VRACLCACVYLHVRGSQSSVGFVLSAAQTAVLNLGVMMLVPEERCAAAPLGGIW